MYAPLYKRLLAFLVDACIVLGVIALFLKPFGYPEDKSDWMLLSFFISLVYFVFSWTSINGQTVGAMLLKIKVVSADGGPMNLGNAFLRASALSLFFAPLGVLCLLLLTNLVITLKLLRTSPYKEKHQTLWDVSSKTCVVNADTSRETFYVADENRRPVPKIVPFWFMCSLAIGIVTFIILAGFARIPTGVIIFASLTSVVISLLIYYKFSRS
jgi:uncharacterized RDD family membrane protein YckC